MIYKNISSGLLVGNLLDGSAFRVNKGDEIFIDDKNISKYIELLEKKRMLAKIAETKIEVPVVEKPVEEKTETKTAETKNTDEKIAVEKNKKGDK